jgi:hypothetical protein
MSLATGHSSDSGRPKKCSFYRILAFTPVKPSVTKGGRPLDSLSCTLVLPSLNNRHHFLTFPLFIAPSPNTSTIRLRISARRSLLVLRNRITDQTSQAARFSILVFILDYRELCVCKGGGGHYDTVLCSTSAPLDIQQTALDSKCTRYLHDCFALSVTFRTRRVIPCRRTQNPFLVAVVTA